MKHLEACVSARAYRQKQFARLWRPFEVGASVFMSGKDLITPFSPLRRYCEARSGLFNYQRRSRKQF